MQKAQNNPKSNRSRKKPQAAEAPAEDLLTTFLVNHAPSDWKKKNYSSLLHKHLDQDKPLNMVVVTADIRKSTFLMKESISFKGFARTTGKFIEETVQLVKDKDGWFDKFTGDGFLAYWITSDNLNETISDVFSVCHIVLHSFQQNGIDIYRANSKNFPSGVGISIGIDGGDTFWVTIANELTIVGPPVVGARRMLETAKAPWETICNVYLGEALYKKRADLLSEHNIEINREFRATKEYENQEVYTITFRKTIGAIQTDTK